MIPAFKSNGRLVEGVHDVSLDDVEQAFAYNERREALFRGLVQALENLKLAKVYAVYVDGSFVTQKTHPEDIDGCWVPNPESIYDLIDEDIRLRHPDSRHRMRQKFGIDFFPGLATEGNTGMPFVEFFQQDFGGPKGILRLDLKREKLHANHQ